MLPAERPRRAGPYRAVLLLAALIVGALVLFPALFGPNVETPPAAFSFDPFSLAVRITNQNVTPLTQVQYTCEATLVELATGLQLDDAKVVDHGNIPKLQGRHAITARCGTAYVINAPLKAAEYRLTLKYRGFPWPRERANEYHFAAVVDSSGRVTKWIRR
jgi:hypothetical protein